MIKLTMTEKGGEPKALSFDKDEVSIGRVSGNDIVLPKGNVSKRHSKLTLRDGHIEVADLKSTNGTYVNGKKITDPVNLSASDRVYVGDFLIVMDLQGAGEAASPSRRMPPPPPPPRAGSSAGNLPTVDSAGSFETAGTAEEDDDDLGLAAKPPRAGRVPPPPPPPPRRPPTPLGSRPLGGLRDGLDGDDASLADELPAPSAAELNTADDSTNNMGLFERRKTADHATFDGNGAPPLSTGSRPGAALAEPAPLPAVPGQAVAPPGEPREAVSNEGLANEGLEALLGDPSVTQIIITGPDATYVDRGAGPEPFAEGLGDPNLVADALWRLANTAVPPPSPDNPVVDVRLPDGTRLAAVFPPVAPAGVVGAIRRGPVADRALVDLIPPGAKDVQTLLEAALGGQRNLLLTGDAAAVAALAGALSGAIPSSRRAVSIGGGLGRGRPGWTELAPTADMAALLRVASALRPDHLLVGELAGVEVLDLLLAATRGQDGLIVALPARGAGEGLARLEALTMPALGTAGAAAALICSTIDLVIHVVAAADGAARIVDVAEPKLDGARLGNENVLAWRSDGIRRGTGGGKLQVNGVSPRLGQALAAVGQALPAGLVRRS